MPRRTRSLLYAGLGIVLVILAAVYLNRCERVDADPRTSPTPVVPAPQGEGPVVPPSRIAAKVTAGWGTGW